MMVLHRYITQTQCDSISFSVVYLVLVLLVICWSQNATLLPSQRYRSTAALGISVSKTLRFWEGHRMNHYRICFYF